MATPKTTSTGITRPVVNIKEKATLFIPEEFLHQMKYLCDEISDVEWSGLIFFTVEGVPQDPKNFRIIPYYIHLMDKGSGSYTEFDDDGSMKSLYEARPELDPFNQGETVYYYGKIHSHHNMSVFHSGTDNQDLQDQAGKYNPFYLSVIVNNRLQLDVKIAFTAEITPQHIKPHKFEGAKEWQYNKKEVLGIIDLNVESETSEYSVPTSLVNRLDEVLIAEKEAIKKQKEVKTEYWEGYTDRHTNGYARQLPPKKEDKAKGTEDKNKPDPIELLSMMEFEEGFEDQPEEVLYVRTTYGKKIIATFLNQAFNIQESPNIVFDILAELTDNAVGELKAEIPKWFNKLVPWAKQNVVLYISEQIEQQIDHSTQAEELFETIFNLLRTKTEA